MIALIIVLSILITFFDTGVLAGFFHHEIYEISVRVFSAIVASILIYYKRNSLVNMFFNFFLKVFIVYCVIFILTALLMLFYHAECYDINTSKDPNTIVAMAKTNWYFAFIFYLHAERLTVSLLECNFLELFISFRILMALPSLNFIFSLFYDLDPEFYEEHAIFFLLVIWFNTLLFFFSLTFLAFHIFCFTKFYLFWTFVFSLFFINIGIQSLLIMYARPNSTLIHFFYCTQVLSGFSAWLMISIMAADLFTFFFYLSVLGLYFFYYYYPFKSHYLRAL